MSTKEEIQPENKQAEDIYESFTLNDITYNTLFTAKFRKRKTYEEKDPKKVTAFIPGNLAQKFIDEHDEVMIERIGGKQGRSKGDIPGVRYQVIQVNDQPLDRLWLGKIQKGRR